MMMMKKILTCLSCFVFIIIICFGAFCNGTEEDYDESSSSSNVAAAPMEMGEREALYSAIQGFVGKWWNGSDLYPDPCGWTPIQGVSCDLIDGLWHVTDLSVGSIHDNSLDCALDVVITPHLFALRHLKSLTFYNCFKSPVRGHRPVTIPTGTGYWEVLAGTLESLEFRSNPCIRGWIPASFGSLWKLQSLVVIDNGLAGEIPSNLGNLVSLRRLVLSENKLSGKIPDSLGGLRDLLILDLSRNTLSGPLPLTFGGLTSLLKLDLSYNKLEDKIPQGLKSLKKLTLLDMSNNRLSGGLSKSLEGMSSLEELVLSNNSLLGGDLMSIEWGSMTSLVSLDLSNTSLRGEIPGSISELKSLRYLGLSDNMLTGEVPGKIAKLPNLTTIYLNGNNLRGELKFPGKFYGRLGRRFGAWGNANLCVPIELVSHHGDDDVPFGVKQCEQDVIHQVNKYRV